TNRVEAILARYELRHPAGRGAGLKVLLSLHGQPDGLPPPKDQQEPVDGSSYTNQIPAGAAATFQYCVLRDVQVLRVLMFAAILPLAVHPSVQQETAGQCAMRCIK